MPFLNITSWGEFYISIVKGTCFWLTNTFLEQLALSESGSREKKQSDQQEEQMLQTMWKKGNPGVLVGL